MSEAIKVVGLAEFNRSLKRMDAELPKALRVALNQSVDVVVRDAQAQVPRRSGRAAASIRAQSTRTVARVKAGGRRAPYYPWLDFGGAVGRHKSVKRAFLKQGRYIYDAYFKRRDSGEFAEILATTLADVARSAGLEVSQGGQ